MIEKLYYSDPYLKEFEASIVTIKKDQIFLDRTAFYPGGGGQQNDLGWIEDAKVSEVGKDGEDIYHKVPDGDFKIGQRVKCRIDWARRYNLMRGHTGQHILFRSMQEQNPDLTVGKVDINSEKKSLFFNGDMSWDMIKMAVRRANEIIAADMTVMVRETSRDSPELDNVRIKADKIAGETVRIVRIGDFDAAACGGIHVKRTGEIGGIAIIKMISGRQASDWDIQFDIGFDGLTASSQLAITTISLSNILGCPPENVVSTVRNLKANVEDLSSRLRIASQEKLEALQPERIGDFKIYSAIVSFSDRKTLNDFASKLIREPGTIAIFCDVAENAYMLIGCNEKISIDCQSFLKTGLEMLNGKGGGKKNFAMGGGTELSRAEDAFKKVKQALKDKLSSEFSCG